MFSSYIRTWRKCFDSNSFATTTEFIFFMVVSYIIPSVLLLYIPKTVSFIAPEIKLVTISSKTTSQLFLALFIIHFLPHFTLQFRRLNLMRQSYWWLLLYYAMALTMLVIILRISTTHSLGLLAASMLLVELIWFGRKSRYCK